MQYTVLNAVQAQGTSNWNVIADIVGSRNSEKWRKKYHYLRRTSAYWPKSNRTVWTEEQDDILKSWVETNGSGNWSELCRILGMKSKTISHRWNEHWEDFNKYIK